MKIKDKAVIFIFIFSGFAFFSLYMFSTSEGKIWRDIAYYSLGIAFGIPALAVIMVISIALRRNWKRKKQISPSSTHESSAKDVEKK